MKHRIQKYLDLINNRGLCIIRNIFSAKDCSKIVEQLETIYLKRLNKKESTGSNGNQCIYNYFCEKNNLIKLIDISIIDEILKKLLDENYVLQSTNAQNRRLEIDPYKKSKNNFKIGDGWHIDSRVINKKKKISFGIGYLVIIALEDFKRDNSSTKFIPNSFKSKAIPKKDGSYKFRKLIMKKGSICIMDTSTWHKGGEPSKNSRWSIFSIYTPWFFKPYFNYKKLTTGMKSLTINQKKLLHFFSDPPSSHNQRINTIIKNN